MRWRPTPPFVIFVLVLLCLGYLVKVIPDTVARYAIDKHAEAMLQPVTQPKYGPDIRHCFRTPQPLWECIIHKKED